MSIFLTKRLLLFLACAVLASAAILPSDGSRADVQAKIDAAVDGDTVTLPAGTFTWATPVTILGKGITLQGAGAGRVVARSTSSVTVGTGSKEWDLLTENIASIQALKSAITPGTILKIYRTGGEQNGTFLGTGVVPWMRGTVTSLVGAHLTMNITSTNHSGTHPLWIITTEAQTTVAHDAPSNNAALTVTEDTTHKNEIAGIRFTHSATGGRDVITQLQLNGVSGGKPILVHDCYFEFTANGSNIRGHIRRGVIWNCSFVAPRMSFNYLALHIVYEAFTDSWTTLSTIGTADTTGENNLYIEDCDIHAYISGTDFDANSRVVFRYNLLNHASAASHGADTGPYGVRHVEIYNNTFAFTGYNDGQTLPLDRQINMRGGTWIITDNVITHVTSTDWGSKTDVKIELQNLQRNSGPNPDWGRNIAGVQYPAPRQVGMGRVTGNGNAQFPTPPHFDSVTYAGDSEPCYLWTNTGGYTLGLFDFISTPGPPGYDSIVNYVVSGRDYFNGTAKTGYAKYTYPHPLHVPPSQVGDPSFNPLPGTFASAQSVTITSATGGATIRYTVDGSTPTASIGTVYTTPVAIAATTTLKAIAYNGVLLDSGVTSGVYTITPSTVIEPVFSPVAGTFSSGQLVTITSATSGATIRYTVDGTTPTSSSGTVYASPVSIPSTTTLKAIAYKSAMTDSTVTSGLYFISIPPTDVRMNVSGTTAVSGTPILP